MNSQVEHASEVLFSENALRVVGNVKFFAGTIREVTSDQLAEQLLSAQFQIAEGVAARVSCVDD